jgi:acyl-CoA thioester hydrolase
VQGATFNAAPPPCTCVHVQPIAIRFRDIDALDHVNHAVILTYAETVRCDWFAAVGYPSMANLPFIIASAHVEYKRPIAKADPVEIAMTVSRIGAKSWTFRYDVRHAATKEVFAEVETVQVAYDYTARATVAIPEKVRRLLEAMLQAPATAR